MQQQPAAAVCLMRFDGGSRGNPGPAGAGAVLTIGDRIVGEAAVFIGRATNNEAEYTGLIVGLEMAQQLEIQELRVEGDSQLIVRQMNGEYQVKQPHLQLLHQRARSLARFHNRKCTISYIPRAQNSKADSLANEAMDTQKSRTFVQDPGLQLGQRVVDDARNGQEATCMAAASNVATSNGGASTMRTPQQATPIEAQAQQYQHPQQQQQQHAQQRHVSSSSALQAAVQAGTSEQQQPGAGRPAAGGVESVGFALPGPTSTTTTFPTSPTPSTTTTSSAQRQQEVLCRCGVPASVHDVAGKLGPNTGRRILACAAARCEFIVWQGTTSPPPPPQQQQHNNNPVPAAPDCTHVPTHTFEISPKEPAGRGHTRSAYRVDDVSGALQVAVPFASAAVKAAIESQMHSAAVADTQQTVVYTVPPANISQAVRVLSQFEVVPEDIIRMGHKRKVEPLADGEYGAIRVTVVGQLADIELPRAGHLDALVRSLDVDSRQWHERGKVWTVMANTLPSLARRWRDLGYASNDNFQDYLSTLCGKQFAATSRNIPVLRPTASPLSSVVKPEDVVYVTGSMGRRGSPWWRAKVSIFNTSPGHVDSLSQEKC